MIDVYITNSNKKEAEKIAMRLLKKRLIACANIFPIKSIYWWKEKIERTNEWVLLAKSTESEYKHIEKEVKKIHSYSIPCIIRFKTNANKDYEKWLKGEIK